MQELISDDDWKIYPVPFTESVSIKPNQLKSGDIVSLAIYDYQGRLIRTICDQQVISATFNGFEWDGLSENGAESKTGTYFISMICNGATSSHPIIKN
jgi:flagellar hook assembly protein FlgD